MSPEHKAAAEQAHYDIGVIAEILESIGSAEISSETAPIHGTSIVWLVEKMEQSLDALDRALSGLPQKGAVE